MKKNLFSLALMAVTLVACNDDTPEPNEDKVPVAHVQRICHGEYYVNSNGASVLENCDFRFYDLQGLLEQEKHMRWVYPDCKMSLDELSALTPSTPWDGPFQKYWSWGNEDMRNITEMEQGRIVCIKNQKYQYTEEGDLIATYQYKDGKLEQSVVRQYIYTTSITTPPMEVVTTKYHWGTVEGQTALVGVTKTRHLTQKDYTGGWKDFQEEDFQQLTLEYEKAYKDHDAVMPELLRMLGLELYPMAEYKDVLDGKFGDGQLLLPTALDVTLDRNVDSPDGAPFHAHRAPYHCIIKRTATNKHIDRLTVEQTQYSPMQSGPYLDVFRIQYYAN